MLADLSGDEHLFALLFGEVLGISRNEILPIAALGICCIVAIAVLCLLLTLATTRFPSPAPAVTHRA